MPTRCSILLAGAALVVLAAPARADLQADIRDCRSLTLPTQAERAEQVCGRALNTMEMSDKVRTALLTVRGEGLFHQAKYAEAIKDFDEALALDPMNHGAWLGRGKSRVETDAYDVAIQDLDQALKLQGSDDRALFWKGEALMRSGRTEEAMQHYNEALIVNRGHPPYIYARARAHNKLGNADMAAADYEAAAKSGGAAITVDLQTHLQAKGHYTSTIDGLYGPGTARAVKACIADPAC